VRKGEQTVSRNIGQLWRKKKGVDAVDRTERTDVVYREEGAEGMPLRTGRKGHERMRGGKGRLGRPAKRELQRRKLTLKRKLDT